MEVALLWFILVSRGPASHCERKWRLTGFLKKLSVHRWLLSSEVCNCWDSTSNWFPKVAYWENLQSLTHDMLKRLVTKMEQSLYLHWEAKEQSRFPSSSKALQVAACWSRLLLGERCTSIKHNKTSRWMRSQDIWDFFSSVAYTWRMLKCPVMWQIRSFNRELPLFRWVFEKPPPALTLACYRDAFFFPD